ncbi:Lysophospholipase L1 [Dethiosulfatibacter aminovorans DSM 17477]|uniref:Lysophospholipase L1 n=1 Tax=Dethiosulfatibacter aminovorans DSM 17477 TaxID=1121476 RepID=A0A1M6M493_9FIRM|nr:GDSL-type esterase/lipase family protein [Dethiosulfatibacter aminovorans]SHJ78314.1 Lysophospholipase L1 [Dethiosulfatibacter aminovorans DSM 17477]
MKIVCLGDSLTEGVAVDVRNTWPYMMKQSTNCEHDIINKGIRGDTTFGMIGRLHEDVLSENPNCVILCGGLNDCWFDTPANIIVSNIYAIVKRLEFNGIKTVIGIPPVVFSKDRLEGEYPSAPLGGWEKLDNLVSIYREALIAICEEYEYSYFDMQDMFNNHSGNAEDLIGDDLIHPNEEGNRYLSEIIYEELIKIYKYNKERVF